MSGKDAFGQDIVVKVRPPQIDQEVGQFKDGARSVPHQYALALYSFGSFTGDGLTD